jgi:hypothetical protein
MRRETIETPNDRRQSKSFVHIYTYIYSERERERSSDDDGLSLYQFLLPARAQGDLLVCTHLIIATDNKRGAAGAGGGVRC